MKTQKNEGEFKEEKLLTINVCVVNIISNIIYYIRNTNLSLDQTFAYNKTCCERGNSNIQNKQTNNPESLYM